MQQSDIRGISWEAPQHHHIEKGADWYWVLGIVGIAGSTTAIILGNTLFGAVILLAMSTMIIFALQKPRLIPFEVTGRGIRIDDRFYPYTVLESFYIDEETNGVPQLLIKSERFLSPLLILPLPEEYVDDIDDIIAARLSEEYLEEPFAHKLLEFFGF